MSTPPGIARTNAAGTSSLEQEGWRIGEVSLLWAVSILLALGLALAAIGLLMLTGVPSTSLRVIAGLVSATAGGIIGASLSILVSRSLDYSALAQMRLTLERTVRSSLTAPEREIATLRHVWHHYHLTLVDGQPTWRYGLFRFDNHATIGSLTADVSVPDAQRSDVMHPYRIDAATRGSRLVLTQTALHGGEAPAVEVFPHVDHQFQHVHTGVGIVQTWDGKEALVPVLMSRQAIVDALPGSVEGAAATALDERWRDRAGGLIRLLPTPVPPPSS